ncbi:MAG: DUF1653 domain-containing protein [Lachnospiraceae bacterium]
MARIPKPHEIYKHFKGNLYQILAVAEHSETGEKLVVYQALYGEFKIYARPLDNFLDKVDREKYPKAGQTFRFELQGAEASRPDKEDDDKEDEAAIASDVVSAATAVGKEAEKEEELNIDPMVLQFLEADTYEERLNILVGCKHRITDEMITTMAVACDVEVPEGSLEERFLGLKNCLSTLDKYECNRLR